MRRGLMPTSVPSGILINPAIWPQQTWAKIGGGLCPLLWGAGYPSNKMWPGLRSTSAASGILIHPAVWPQYMGRKVGAVPLFRGEIGPQLTQCRLGRGLHPYQVASSSSSSLVVTDMGQKLGAVPLWGGGAGSQSNTMWPGPRPTSKPSYILKLLTCFIAGIPPSVLMLFKTSDASFPLASSHGSICKHKSDVNCRQI